MDYPQAQLSTPQLQAQLEKTGDFLRLTRSYEYSMTAFHFEVYCTKKMAKTKVSVLDMGIIMFEPLNH